MAVSATNAYLYAFRSQDGALIRVARIDVTGLAIGNNTVPHGLGVKPLAVGIEPTGNATFYEYQAVDATNVYINASAAVTCSVYVEY